MNKRWLVNKTNREFLEHLSRKASISPTFAQILVNRGIKDIESIKDFLSPSLKNLHDPFLMSDMEKAVERIKTALTRDEIVFVCGDYDVDGLTSTALLVSALRTLGLKSYYHIPNRLTEGYGLSKEGIQKAQSHGAGLIITADCGISSVEEVSLCLSQGIDIIITDHHEPPQKLPDATAIINPHRLDPDCRQAGSEYPFKNLAGVGVAYKLVQALFHDSRLTIHDSRFEDFLALVAIGTIADSVPLTGENRILVTYGLKAINKSQSMPWVQSLKETAGIDNKSLRSSLLSYTIIPRINAAGRLGDANHIVELFLTQDAAVAKGIASFLEDQNRKRQRIEGDVYKSALEMVDTSHLDSAIVLYSPTWHPGVMGIVASRIVEMFYRPTFLFSVKDGIAKGSARSIPPFHIYRGITECANILLGYGGHSQAAGIRLYAENLLAFKEQINSVVENTLTEEDMVPTLEMDAEVELFEVSFNLVKELGILEPFGNSNQQPLLGIKGVEVVEPRIVGDNHLKMCSKQRSLSIDTIGFSMGNLLEQDASGFTVCDSQFVDIAFVPCLNEWNNSKFLQLNLKALRPSL